MERHGNGKATAMGREREEPFAARSAAIYRALQKKTVYRESFSIGVIGLALIDRKEDGTAVVSHIQPGTLAAARSKIRPDIASLASAERLFLQSVGRLTSCESIPGQWRSRLRFQEWLAITVETNHRPLFVQSAMSFFASTASLRLSTRQAPVTRMQADTRALRDSLEARRR